MRAASDYVRTVPDQIAPWLAGRLVSLGTDGFGRSDTREALRAFFEVDAAAISSAAVTVLAQRGQLTEGTVQKSMQLLSRDSEDGLPLSSSSALAHERTQVSGL